MRYISNNFYIKQYLKYEEWHFDTNQLLSVLFNVQGIDLVKECKATCVHHAESAQKIFITPKDPEEFCSKYGKLRDDKSFILVTTFPNNRHTGYTGDYKTYKRAKLEVLIHYHIGNLEILHRWNPPLFFEKMTTWSNLS